MAADERFGMSAGIGGQLAAGLPSVFGLLRVGAGPFEGRLRRPVSCRPSGHRVATAATPESKVGRSSRHPEAARLRADEESNVEAAVVQPSPLRLLDLLRPELVRPGDASRVASIIWARSGRPRRGRRWPSSSGAGGSIWLRCPRRSSTGPEVGRRNLGSCTTMPIVRRTSRRRAASIVLPSRSSEGMSSARFGKSTSGIGTGGSGPARPGRKPIVRRVGPVNDGAERSSPGPRRH